MLSISSITVAIDQEISFLDVFGFTGDWEKGSSRNQRQPQQGISFHHHGGRGGGGRGSRASFKYGKPPASGEDAFCSAKARYWAQINDLPCDIPLLDRDMYIDEIDWESEVDPELFLDLERDDSSAVPSDDVDIEKSASYLTSGWDSFPLPNEEIQPTGWVINNEDPVAATGWGDIDTKENNSSGDCLVQNDGWVTSNEPTPLATSGWEDVNKKSSNSYWKVDGGWGDEKAIKKDSWDQWGSNSWQNNDGSWGQWETSQLKGGTGYDHSDHTTYFEKMDKNWNNYHHNNNSSRYCRGRRTNFMNGRALGHSKWNRAPQNWNSLHTCGPTK